MDRDGKQVFPVTYKIFFHDPPLSASEVKSDPERGGCDAVLIGSLLFNFGGSSSTCFISRDGRTSEPINSRELWKTWTLLAHQLAEDSTLDAGRQRLCADVFEVVRQAVLSHREERQVLPPVGTRWEAAQLWQALHRAKAGASLIDHPNPYLSSGHCTCGHLENQHVLATDAEMLNRLNLPIASDPDGEGIEHLEGWCVALDREPGHGCPCEGFVSPVAP